MNNVKADIATIRNFLRASTGRAWNVRACGGASVGGIQIETPLARRDPERLSATPCDDVAALAKAFGVPETRCFQGVYIPRAQVSTWVKAITEPGSVDLAAYIATAPWV